MFVRVLVIMLLDGDRSTPESPGRGSVAPHTNLLGLFRVEEVVDEVIEEEEVVVVWVLALLPLATLIKKGRR